MKGVKPAREHHLESFSKLPFLVVIFGFGCEPGFVASSESGSDELLNLP
jgi:hypothetical protein